MNENDIKTRKQWLIVWILCNLISFVAMTFPAISSNSPAMPPLIRYISIGSSLFALGICAIISYRCIYKKPGTKFLTFVLISSMFSLVSTPIYFLIGKMPPVEHFPHYRSYLIASQLMSVLWLIACWRMRKTNKRLQALK
ncbi:MAG: hypothetical protein K1000chlam3_01459 [Chlamydiae bacterium]|nr:hypothetical protein [Chlamydiota bacterium]